MFVITVRVPEHIEPEKLQIIADHIPAVIITHFKAPDVKMDMVMVKDSVYARRDCPVLIDIEVPRRVVERNPDLMIQDHANGVARAIFNDLMFTGTPNGYAVRINISDAKVAFVL